MLKINMAFILIIQMTLYSCSVYSKEENIISNKYAFCNVYIETVCFGIKQGDKLNLQIPIDYLLYDVNLSFGGEVRIYYGSHPEKINAKSVLLNKFSDKNGAQVSLYQINNSQYRIQYYSKDSEFLADIFLNKVNKDNYIYFNDFLYNFRKCKVNSNSVLCSSERVFKERMLEK